MLWWNDELETGVKVIDEQHKSIFVMANEIFEMGIKTNIEDLKKIISFLMSYSNNHFSEEEQLMTECDYDRLLEHREQHNLLVEEIYKIYLRVNNSKIDELFNDLKLFTIELLANHINTVDKDFVKFYNNVK